MELTKEEIEEYRIGMRKMYAIALHSEVDALCGMALAHLAARERSVQGWAVMRPSREMITVSLTEDGAWANDADIRGRLVLDGYTCQPVTITINAAGQESNGRGNADACEADKTASVPAPAAPVAESAEPVGNTESQGMPTDAIDPSAGADKEAYAIKGPNGSYVSVGLSEWSAWKASKISPNHRCKFDCVPGVFVEKK